MKVGLALSGGGAKGIAHLGIIKALKEGEVKIQAVAGTSAGAIVGSLFCYGYDPNEILKILDKISFFRYFKFSMSLNGLLNIERLGEILIKYMPEDNFKNLKIPLTIAATEIKTGKTIYFDEGELIKPILASSCVPVIFNPLEYKDGIYVDGGILKNLPVEALVGRCEKIIGCDCNPIGNNFKLKGVKKIIERSMLLAVNSNNEHSKIKCDAVIEPPELENYSAFDISKAGEIFDIGYSYTKSCLKDTIKKLEKAEV